MDLNDEVKLTQKCKCGKKAEFIKDYWISEACVKKEKTYDNTIVASMENTCGILRRRYCSSCLAKIAAQRKRYNARLNLILFISILIPLAMLTGKELFDLITAAPEDNAKPYMFICFAVLSIAALTALLIYIIKTQNALGKIASGNCTDIKTVDMLLDSMNEPLSDWKAVKEIPSTDVIVDGDGRVNYDMERSGFNMKIMIEGNIVTEAVRSRLRYPVKEEFEHIRRAYLNASLMEDNLRISNELKAEEKDFDIRNGILRRYSGIAVEISVPDTVTELGEGCFKNSKNCEKLILPESVSVIASEAFSGCPAESINIPSAVTRIEKFTFYRSSVKEIIIPEGVTEICENAFCECYSLERVVIPSTCKRIGEYAFKDCIHLTDIELTEGIEAIGDCAFQGCYSVTIVNIPDGVCEIGNFAFEQCTSLESLYLPDTVQFMGGRAFDGNINMTIYGKRGSYAEQYADETRRRFSELIDKSEFSSKNKRRNIKRT